MKAIVKTLGRQRRCLNSFAGLLLAGVYFCFFALAACMADSSWKPGEFKTDDGPESRRLNECPVAFSPDGRLAASGGQDNVVRLWDMTTHRLLKTISVSNGWVMAVAFSPDSKSLASGSGYPGKVMIWDAQTGMLKRTLGGHSKWVRSLAFSPNGKTLASGSEEKAVKLWDVQTGTLQKSLTGGHGKSAIVWSLAFSPDGKILASGDLIQEDRVDSRGRVDGTRTWGSEIRVWDVKTGKLKWALPGGAAPVVFSPDGKVLASTSRGDEVILWDAQTGKLHRKLAHKQPLGAIAFSKDGAVLASSTGFIFGNAQTKQRLIHLWDAQTWSLKSTLQSHGAAVRAMAFSPHGDMLACGDYASSVEIQKIK